MKKLIWSAFAMSLILIHSQVSAQTESVDEFLGLESELLPELKGEQGFTGSDFHEKESWNIDATNVVQDLPEPVKGQKYSIIPWSEIDPIEWLSVDKWIIERGIKDKIPDWKIQLREADHRELVGKVLQCRGVCTVARGLEKANVQHLSRIEEGDEITTEKNSIAWIYLMDGSLLRISPDSSISLQEINIHPVENFILARLNQGHVYWHSRSKSELPLNESPETDTLSTPLLVREANQEYFERALYKKQKGNERVNAVMNLFDNAIKEQFEAINTLKSQSNSHIVQSTKFMLVAPNGSVVAEGGSFDFVYLPGNLSYFKKRTENEGSLSLYLRGYLETEAFQIKDMKWYLVEKNGRVYRPMENVPAELQILELLTRRIKTLELAREIWVKKYTVPILSSVENPEKVAREYGFKVWGDELQKRFQFLLEYTRRIETTNLRSLQNLLTKLEGKGETINRELSSDFYQASLNDYLLGLKSRYDSKNMRVKELNDLQYYVWILRNGKL